MKSAKILLAAILLIYAVIAASKWNEIGRIRRFFVIVAIVGALLAGWSALL
jgi:hypothetical protein